MFSMQDRIKGSDDELWTAIRGQVEALCARFPVYSGTRSDTERQPRATATA